MKRIEEDINIFKDRLQVRESYGPATICDINTCINENTRLQKDLKAANAIIKELQGKIMTLENDKTSLTTAIRIIQQDTSQLVNNNCARCDGRENLCVEEN